jgi:transcriptional regulator with XRE-family HTH domain
MLVKPEQVRAARAMLGMEQKALAERARVSVATVRRLEAARRSVGAESLARVRHALEDAGAEFIENGVRRRPPRSVADKRALVRDLMAISEKSAALQAGNEFTEDDLYDENGLPA